MIATRFLMLGCALAAGLCAQAPSKPSGESPEAIVGTVDGTPVTAGELQHVLAGSPKELQATLQNSREELLRYYGFIRKLAMQAEEAKLDREAPYADRIRLTRYSILAEAQLDRAYSLNPLTNEELRAYYEEHKDSYAWVKTKVIYIPFSANLPASQPEGMKRALSEAQAKAKSENVAAAARAGKDFVVLVKEHSEHTQSADKDGDFGLVQASDNYPAEVKMALFSADKGGIAGPVRLANGFYIFRIEDAGVKPYQDVHQDIYNLLKDQRWREWMEKTRRSVQVTVSK